MYPVLLLIAFGLLVFYFYKQAFERPPNFPPGPPRLPIWGSYWFLLFNNYKFLHLAIQKMSQKYKSKLIGFYLGPFPAVVAMDFDSVREVLTRPEFQGRPETIVTKTRAMDQRLGIFFTDGTVFTEQKRFTLRHLRDFGFGRRFVSTEVTLQEETQDVLELLRGTWTDKDVCKDGFFHLPGIFCAPFINLFWSIMGGNRYGRDDYPLVRDLCRGAALFVQSADPFGGAISLTPWIRYFAPEASGLLGQKKGNQTLLDHMKKAIEEHRATYSDDHMRDFIDVYIQEMKQKCNAANECSSFTDDQLIMIGTDSLMASATTVTGTMTFAFQSLFHYPEVQKKIQKEIDEKIGRDRLPTLDDRINLPYTEATVREVMRRFTMLPVALPHLVTEDTQLQGYSIPKNTLIFASLFGLHMDPDLWGDPEVFRPERFLGDNGQLKKDISLPFGGSKRVCPGETFSRQSIFVLFAAMLQNFNFAPADPKSLPDMNDMYAGLAVSPKEMWVKVQPRD